MDILYSPGISFDNPEVVRPAAPVRLRPWFYQETAIGPLTMVSKKSQWSSDPQLHPYSPIWKRDYKQRNIERLGAYVNDMPNFQQLGEAPAPTTAQSTVSRDPLGFLTNLIAKSGDIATGVTNTMLKDAAIKTETSQMVMSAQLQQSNSTMLLVTAGIGAAGLLAFYLWRK